jgi:hypothetical protein
MIRIDEYREALERAANQKAYLLAHSGLPGPRGNLELARAAAEACSKPELRRWARLGPDEAPTGTAEEFLAFCGVLGLGRALVEDDLRALHELRRTPPIRAGACARRWRWRSSFGARPYFEALTAAMDEWARGSPLERRAAAAALCEPALLTTPRRSRLRAHRGDDRDRAGRYGGATLGGVRVVDLDAIRRRRGHVRPVEGHRLRGRRILRRAEERRRRRCRRGSSPRRVQQDGEAGEGQTGQRSCPKEGRFPRSCDLFAANRHFSRAR